MGGDGDPVERHDLDAGQRRIGDSSPADQRLELPLVLLKTGFGIDQILAAGGELGFRCGRVSSINDPICTCFLVSATNVCAASRRWSWPSRLVVGD